MNLRFPRFLLAYKMRSNVFPPVVSPTGTMPPYDSTLGYIDLAPSDSEEEHSSPPGSVIDLTQGEEEEEMQAPPEMADELVEMLDQEDIDEHRVGEDSFDTLREDRVRAWLGVRKKGKEAGRTVRCPHFPTGLFI